MPWTALPRGSFTCIDWADPDAAAGFDPYLAWAEADAFSGCGMEKPPKWLPLLIELAPEVSIAQLQEAAAPDWLSVPLVYTSSAAPSGLRYCTARVGKEFFRQIRPGGQLHGLVQRFELGMTAGTHAADVDPASPEGREAPGALLQGKVMGIIDGGLAFAHASFLRQGRTRIRHFWRQDLKGVGRLPSDLGYGHELTGAEIDAVIDRNIHGGLVDETAVYACFDMGMELNKGLNHGTHVLDIACGPLYVTSRIAGLPPDPAAPPTWAPAHDEASRCDIVAVQLDWNTVVDTSGGSMNVHIMDGLMYILSRCDPAARIAVNLSWGTLAGPHDGSSVLEAAMDQLIALKEAALQIVLPASNSYQSRTHANATLDRDEEVTLNWRGQPGDKTQNFLEIWLPEGAKGVTVQITPPGHPPLPALGWGRSGRWNPDGVPHPACALIYLRRVAIGRHGTCALIAVAPTFSFEQTRTTAPSGVWKITVRNTDAGSVTFDAYVERDDEIIGVRTGALQSHFEDAWYDTSGNPGSFVDDPANPTPIRRSGSFNSIATGCAIQSVGGVRASGPRWALYSPQRPDPDAGRPERPAVVKMPSLEALSDENGTLLGLNAAGSRSGGVARLVGTSDAAPQITRKVFNAM